MVTVLEVVGDDGPVPNELACRYRRSAPDGPEVVWAVTVRRYSGSTEATSGFASARRTEIAQEVDVVDRNLLGDEAAAGRSLNDVLLVRRGAIVVQVVGRTREGSMVADLKAVFRLMLGRLG